MSLFLQYALSFVGNRYRWGGKSPAGGIDCSGLVCELLKATGLMEDAAEFNAQGIYDWLQLGRSKESEKISEGDIAFYGKDNKNITHVVFCLNELIAVGADGGGHTVIDSKSADQSEAFVKLRPIKSPCYRQDVVAILSPSYP